MYSEGKIVLCVVVYPVFSFITYFGGMILILDGISSVYMKVLAWVLTGNLVAVSIAHICTAAIMGLATGMRGVIRVVSKDVELARIMWGNEAAAEHLQKWNDELSEILFNEEAENVPVVEEKLLEV